MMKLFTFIQKEDLQRDQMRDGEKISPGFLEYLFLGSFPFL